MIDTGCGIAPEIIHSVDEATIVKMNCRILEKPGYQVTPQTNSLEALSLFRNQADKFDLIVCDMTMPHMTGEQLAKEMMRIRPDIPVILCTGYSNRINEELALQIGIKEFVYKPIKKNDLALTIRKVLDRVE